MTWFFRRARKKKKRCKNDEERLTLYRHMCCALERYWKNVTYEDPLVESTRQWWLENRGDQLLTFLKYKDVPWDNNAAERVVRSHEGIDNMTHIRKLVTWKFQQLPKERQADPLCCHML